MALAGALGLWTATAQLPTDLLAATAQSPTGLLSGSQTPARPARIVSIVPALTEMLFAIGAGDRVVGVSSYARHPPAVERIPRVGGLVDPDVERVLALAPDLVLVYATQTDFREQLGRAGIDTFVYRHGGLEAITRTMRDLGRRTGFAAAADDAAAAIEARLRAVAARVAGRPRPSTLLVFDRHPLVIRGVYASGGVGFLHDLLEVTGAANVLGHLERESVPISSEGLLAAAPEVIVELRYVDGFDAADVAREEASWRTLPGIPAVRAGRVHLLIGDEFVVPGPRIAGAAERLARVVHPEAYAAAGGQPTNSTGTFRGISFAARASSNSLATAARPRSP